MNETIVPLTAKEKRKQPTREWLCAYWLNRAADQRRGAQRWPDMRAQCIAGALDMVSLARDRRLSGALAIGLPKDGVR